MNKKLFLLSILAVVLILGGCTNSNRIDTSSLVQTVTAENKSGKTVYNFYLLKNCEDVQGVSVEADSLEKAVKICAENAVSGDVVLLSPACESLYPDAYAFQT